MLPGYGRNGSTRLLAGNHQFRFELVGIAAMSTPGRISGNV
jgi:hypothetical protein